MKGEERSGLHHFTVACACRIQGNAHRASYITQWCSAHNTSVALERGRSDAVLEIAIKAGDAHHSTRGDHDEGASTNRPASRVYPHQALQHESKYNTISAELLIIVRYLQGHGALLVRRTSAADRIIRYVDSTDSDVIEHAPDEFTLACAPSETTSIHDDTLPAFARTLRRKERVYLQNDFVFEANGSRHNIRAVQAQPHVATFGPIA